MNAEQFTVSPGSYRIVSVAGLTAADAIRVQYRACKGDCPGDGTELWVDFMPCGDRTFNLNRSTQCFGWPGTYRLVEDSFALPDVTVCVSVEHAGTGCPNGGGCG
jgi:hypothetical protein